MHFKTLQTQFMIKFVLSLYNVSFIAQPDLIHPLCTQLTVTNEQVSSKYPESVKKIHGRYRRPSRLLFASI